jgi:hypothetical protein
MTSTDTLSLTGNPEEAEGPAVRLSWTQLFRPTIPPNRR